MEQAYYTLEQSKQILQVSESTIRRGIKNGTIPRAKFSGKILIPAWFFKQALEGQAIKPVS
nr:helix-turn-helix domain-containing protein [uncultured Anaerocolumna sp.]